MVKIRRNCIRKCNFFLTEHKKEKEETMYTIEQFDQGKTKVLKYILYQKRSEQEIRRKFASTLEEDLLEDIIEYLKQANYINDKQYIEKTIHNFMLLKNLSIKEIKYKLQAKGIAVKDFENYQEQHEEELQQYERKSAETIANKRKGSYEQIEIRQYLIKKGYSREAIDKAIKGEE